MSYSIKVMLPNGRITAGFAFCPPLAVPPLGKFSPIEQLARELEMHPYNGDLEMVKKLWQIARVSEVFEKSESEPFKACKPQFQSLPILVEPVKAAPEKKPRKKSCKKVLQFEAESMEESAAPAEELATSKLEIEDAAIAPPLDAPKNAWLLWVVPFRSLAKVLAMEDPDIQSLAKKLRKVEAGWVVGANFVSCNPNLRKGCIGILVPSAFAERHRGSVIAKLGSFILGEAYVKLQQAGCEKS